MGCSGSTTSCSPISISIMPAAPGRFSRNSRKQRSSAIRTASVIWLPRQSSGRGHKRCSALSWPRPVPQESILFEEEIGNTGIRAFLTPGHAQHHCCYLLGDLLFAGEVAGVRSVVPEGILIRPATPPRFILETALDSVERMLALKPGRMVFAHYGMVDTAIEHLEIARNQLLLWVEGAKAVAAVPEEEREEAMFAWLQEHDEHYRNIAQLSEDIRARERYFFGNTYRGMAEYVAAK